MAILQELTVGQVSGMIAAAVFVIQFLIPLALPIVLVGLLRPKHKAVTQTAVSWSVIGRFLHSSLWPLLLHTDSAASLSASRPALFASFFKGFMLILIALAAVVTPLGLYEGIVADRDSSVSPFHYVKDLSPMGYGTAPRDVSTTWSRLCGAYLIIPCPNDYNSATVTDNSSMVSVDYDADWYDTRVPERVVDTLQSGVKNLGASVSGPFDIQYRSYIKATADDDEKKGPVIDNGTARTVGSYQPLSSLILGEDIVPIEGLIVDMKNGGIGFRNHTAPAWRQFGSTWSEDVLFVVPETACVDTNLTIDFTIPRTRSQKINASSSMWQPVITDRGGFAQLNQTYPRWELGDIQAHPSLYYRAYRAAWLRNTYSMAYMNVTSLKDGSEGSRAFAYMNSEINKTFPLSFPDGKTATGLQIVPQSLSVATLFGNYLDGTAGVPNTSATGNETSISSIGSRDPLYTNPFDIGTKDWASIDTLCRGHGALDYANITQIASRCGVLNGAARRSDGSSSLLFDAGSAWTLPMFTCSSTAKAMIKTVAFRFNGTDNALSSLSVVSIEDKIYKDEKSMPLWAVEQTDMYLKNGAALWGIVADDKPTLNLSTVRAEHLYLPDRDQMIGWQNLPGQDFAAIALDVAYQTGDTGPTNPVDYSGRSNLAMFKKWQELSRDASTSAKILNLIWTDVAANLVVGTKGLQPATDTKQKRDQSDDESEVPRVTTFTRQIKYKYKYGIPAFLVLVLASATFLSTVYHLLFSGANLTALRMFLNQTSVGRLLVAHASTGQSETDQQEYNVPRHQAGYSDVPTEAWVKGAGKEVFTLGAAGWGRGIEREVEVEMKGGTVASYAPVPPA